MIIHKKKTHKISSHFSTKSHVFMHLFVDIFTNLTDILVLYFDLWPEQNAIQGDAPEGSDTFQWQLCEEIAWAEIG